MPRWYESQWMKRSFASKPRAHCFSSVAPICSPSYRSNLPCDNAQFNFAESRIKRIAANGTSLTNFRIQPASSRKHRQRRLLLRLLCHTRLLGNTTPLCVSICTMLVCPPTMVTHAHFSPFQTLARGRGFHRKVPDLKRLSRRQQCFGIGNCLRSCVFQHFQPGVSIST